MSPEATLICYLIAVICWILAAAMYGRINTNWVALGLIAAILPNLWNAAEQAF